MTYEEERAAQAKERAEYERGTKTPRFAVDVWIQDIVREWPMIPHKAVEAIRNGLRDAEQNGKNITGDALAEEMERRAAVIAAHDVAIKERERENYWRAHLRVTQELSQNLRWLMDADKDFAAACAKAHAEREKEPTT